MWTKIKRILLVIIGVTVALLGLGSIVSVLLGYYGDDGLLMLGIALMATLVTSLGAFLIKIGLHGTDEDVTNTDLM